MFVLQVQLNYDSFESFERRIFNAQPGSWQIERVDTTSVHQWAQWQCNEIIFRVSCGASVTFTACAFLLNAISFLSKSV